MGEYAEMLLDGSCDEWTGEYIGPAVGYPRSLDPDHYSNEKGRTKQLYRVNALRGLENYLKANGISKTGRCIWKYSRDILEVEYKPDDVKAKKLAATEIQSQFQKFINWVHTDYKTNKTQ